MDRKFSFGNLKKEIEKNLEKMKRRGREEYLREQAQKQASREAQETAKQEAKQQTLPLQQQSKDKAKNLSIGGVELTSQQWQTLQEGGYIFLENMNKKDGSGTFSSYVFLNDEKDKVFSSSAVKIPIRLLNMISMKCVSGIRS